MLVDGGDPGGSEGQSYKVFLDTASKLTELLWSSYVPQLKSIRSQSKQHKAEFITLLGVPSLPLEVTKLLGKGLTFYTAPKRGGIHLLSTVHDTAAKTQENNRSRCGED